MPKLKDPVEEVNKKRAAETLEKGVKTISLDSLTIGDLKSVPRSQAAGSHPFIGYPMEDIQIGTWFDPEAKKEKPVLVKKSFLVFLNPSKDVPQDKSGKRVTITETTTRKNKIVDLKTFHSRMIRNFEEGDEANSDVVFDREFTLGDGSLVYMAVVPEHSVRAQLVFEKDNKGITRVNEDYLLADDKQVGRLRKLFDQIYANKINAAERAAKDFDETPES